MVFGRSRGARHAPLPLLALAVAGVMGGTACSGPATRGGSGAAAGVATGAAATAVATDGAAPRGELPWGPTTAELAAASTLVRGWDAGRLAGQVIIGRYHGTEPERAAALVRRHHLAGLAMTGGNIAGAAQVRNSTAAIQAAVRADGRDFPAIIGVDQEGGTTAHLGELATAFPAFMSAGAAVAGGIARGEPDQGERVVADAARATAVELRALGFTWVFAPVADVTIGPADPTIGTRSASDDPQVAAAVTAAAVRGYREAGLVSTVKHYPGHGSVTADSHRALPVQKASLRRLAERDLVPFAAAVRAGAPAVMMSHLAVSAIDPGVPISLSAKGYHSLRRDVAFAGVTVTDSLGMGAVRRGGDPAVRALAAGADLLLMPADTAAAHVAVTKAITSGSVPRARAEEAAAKVVALQRWQARTESAVPVPDDAARQAAAASRALSAAAITLAAGPCRPAALRAVRVVGGSAEDRARFAAAARRGDLRLGSGPTVALVGSGSASADVVAALGWPTTLARSRGEVEYALYGRSDGAFDALVGVLTGAADARGALPIAVPGAQLSRRESNGCR